MRLPRRRAGALPRRGPLPGRRFQLDNLAHPRFIVDRLRRRTLSPPVILICAFALLCSLAPGLAGASGATLASLQAQLGHQMRIAGSRSGAYVYDVSTHTPLFAQNATHSSPPASVEKLYTSTAALLLLGSDGHLNTTVLGVGSLDSTGAWHGSLYLRGGGDPTFGSSSFIHSNYGGQGASVTALAHQIAAQGIKRVEGQIVGDESFLDSLRGGPTTGYAQDLEVEGTLSGLAFNRGQVGSARGPHAPAAYAALQLLHALRALHIAVNQGISTGPTPTGAQPLAVVQSPPLSTLLGLMDRPSDNFFAETLVKDLGALAAGAGTTSAGAAVVKRTLIQRLGIHPIVVDGSGLSHTDSTSPLAVVTLLNALSGTKIGGVLQGDLAVAGRSGTLVLRMRGTTAAGRCQAKTGTLNGVSNLAGWCETVGGHTLAFCFLIDGDSELAAHELQYRMTIALARYGG
jgi:serine-type D-Ala-D-Ala carboxypeptidase/endopeptidase (penicillin-binding protein 4)